MVSQEVSEPSSKKELIKKNLAKPPHVRKNTKILVLSNSRLFGTQRLVGEGFLNEGNIKIQF